MRYINLSIIALLIFLLFATKLNAQQLSNIKVYGLDQGLTSRNVITTFEANDGFLWLGTQSGLCRFDGESFVPFKLLDAQSELAYLTINSIVEKGQYLWIATDEGLFTLNTQTYLVKKIILPGLKNSAIKINVLKLLSQHRIAIGSNQSLCWIVNNENEIFPIKNPYDQSNNFQPVLSIVEDASQNIWVTTSFDELYAFNLKQKSINYYQKFKQNLDKLYFNNTYGLVVLTEKTFASVDTIHRKLMLDLPSFFNNAIDLFFEKNNDLWLLKRNLDIVHHSSQKDLTFQGVFDKMNEENIRINSVHQSKCHFWIATNNGLVKASFNQFTIQQFFSHSLIRNKQFNSSVRGMTEDEQKNLYFASYMGLYKLAFPYVKHKPEPLLVDSVSNYIPYALAYEKGKIWIGSEGGLLGSFNLKDKKLKVYNAATNVRSNRFVISLFNETNHLLLGTYGGLYIFNKKKETILPLELNFKGKNYNDATIYQIVKLKNQYWLASNKGLFKCDEKFNIKAVFSFKNQSISSFIVDSVNNCFWVGTLGEGFYQFKENAIYKNYNFQDGLADNRIVSLTLHANKLFIATYFGLSCFDVSTNTFTNFHTDQGLTHNEFNNGATYLTSDKKLFMGGINGYNLIDFNLNDQVKHHLKAPFIASFYTLNGNVENRIYTDFSELTKKIPSNNRVIEIEFGLTDFNQPEKNIYAYKLDGVDKDWVFIGNRNYLRLINLTAGKYTLHLKAAGSNGNWVEMKTPISFEITPIFYQTKWFFVLVSLLIISLIALYSYLKINKIKTVHFLRMQISTDLHDEVGGVLTAVGMQAELLLNSDLTNKAEQLKKISLLSREAVATMRDVIWSIDAQQERFVDLLDRMKEFVNVIFDDTNIQVTFEHQIDTNYEFIDLITKQNTYLIFKEAMNNIVKHANVRKVSISLLVKNKTMKLMIQSDGTTVYQVKEGMGLRNMKVRSIKMNADLRIDEFYNILLIKRI
jgi:signal transduction histidine kinase